MRDHCRASLHQMNRRQAPVTLEICTATLEDCLTAQTEGARRVELNSGLALGGLTPSAGVVAEGKRQTDLKVIAMIRPRDGGFHYSETELKVMERNVDILLKHRADGFAFGVLNADRTIHIAACRRLIKHMKGRDAVFHRAFDLVPNPEEALETLIELGVKRVLTSGQQPTALEGASLIRKLIAQAAGRIEILPGSGVSKTNALELIEKTGATQIHASLSGVVEDRTMDSDLPFQFRAAPLPEHQHKQTHANRVRAMVSLLDGSTP